MKKTYKVLWGDVAENDLIGIIEYIADESPANAEKILIKIKHKVSKLFHMPQKGRVVPELLEQGIATYRELIVAPWRIIYKIENKKVLVFSVLDARRNIEDILLRRLIEL
ncbi:MAG TPA: type II toxin-antitoxin system RelE/ParE family toxin [Myxococcota bacterium]|nr:type II toxin-antitoxin system RelE/ParE family toxin [Myxococcota bacterium]